MKYAKCFDSYLLLGQTTKETLFENRNFLKLIFTDRIHTEPEKPGKPGKPGKSAIFTKSQGKPVIVRELFIIFIQVWEKSEKTKYLVCISFSLTIGIVVCKVVALIVASECELYHLAL